MRSRSRLQEAALAGAVRAQAASVRAGPRSGLRAARFSSCREAGAGPPKPADHFIRRKVSCGRVGERSDADAVAKLWAGVRAGTAVRSKNPLAEAALAGAVRA